MIITGHNPWVMAHMACFITSHMFLTNFSSLKLVVHERIMNHIMLIKLYEHNGTYITSNAGNMVRKYLSVPFGTILGTRIVPNIGD